MSKQKFFRLVGLVYVLTGLVLYGLTLISPGFKMLILITANTLMAMLACASFVMVNRSIGDNPHAFVRGVNGASLLKLMVCLVAALIYIGIYRSNVHKPTIFVMFGIYIVYTGLETFVLSGLARVKKDK